MFKWMVIVRGFQYLLKKFESKVENLVIYDQHSNHTLDRVKGN